MPETDVVLETGDGAMPVLVVGPDRPAPVVLMLMDGRGIREPLRTEARRLAAEGYCVLLPNLFYRAAGSGPIVDVTDAERMTELNTALTDDRAQLDAEACLAFAAGWPGADASRCGIFGYCMGGRLAVVLAQRLGLRIKATVALHPGFMATRSPTSPHLFLDRISAELYFGLPAHDPYLSPGQISRLREALDATDVRYAMDIFAGTTHGFGVPGNDEYAPAAVQAAWSQALALFDRTLSADTEGTDVHG